MLLTKILSCPFKKMHAEVLDWLANKECGCLVRSRSTSACPRPWCTGNVLYKQCKLRSIHACVPTSSNQAQELLIPSVSRPNLPVRNMHQTTPYSSQPMPQTNPSQWSGGGRLCCSGVELTRRRPGRWYNDLATSARLIQFRFWI